MGRIETDIHWGEIYAQPDGAMITEKVSGTELVDIQIRSSLTGRIDHEKFAAAVKQLEESLNLDSGQPFTCESCQTATAAEDLIFSNGIFCPTCAGKTAK
jgi:hypothetical protein